MIKSGQTARSLSGAPGERRVAERFSFSKSTRRVLVGIGVEVGHCDEEGREESSALPRVKPEPTCRVTEIILPVKRRVPCSDSRRGGMGSVFVERERAIERPIVHARGRMLVLCCGGGDYREEHAVREAVAW